MSTHITATVGRVVLFNPAGLAGKARGVVPWAATVAAVIPKAEDGLQLVNLGIWTAEGNSFGRIMVPLVQSDEQPPDDDTPYCEWMPYQKKVASGEIEPTRHAS